MHLYDASSVQSSALKAGLEKAVAAAKQNGGGRASGPIELLPSTPHTRPRNQWPVQTASGVVFRTLLRHLDLLLRKPGPVIIRFIFFGQLKLQPPLPVFQFLIHHLQSDRPLRGTFQPNLVPYELFLSLLRNLIWVSRGRLSNLSTAEMWLVETYCSRSLSSIRNF